MLLCMTLLPWDTEFGESRRDQDDQSWQLCETMNDISGQMKQGKSLWLKILSTKPVLVWERQENRKSCIPWAPCRRIYLCQLVWQAIDANHDFWFSLWELLLPSAANHCWCTAATWAPSLGTCHHSHHTVSPWSLCCPRGSLLAGSVCWQLSCTGSFLWRVITQDAECAWNAAEVTGGSQEAEEGQAALVSIGKEKNQGKLEEGGRIPDSKMLWGNSNCPAREWRNALRNANTEITGRMWSNTHLQVQGSRKSALGNALYPAPTQSSLGTQVTTVM